MTLFSTWTVSRTSIRISNGSIPENFQSDSNYVPTCTHIHALIHTYIYPGTVQILKIYGFGSKKPIITDFCRSRCLNLTPVRIPCTLCVCISSVLILIRLSWKIHYSNVMFSVTFTWLKFPLMSMFGHPLFTFSDSLPSPQTLSSANLVVFLKRGVWKIWQKIYFGILWQIHVLSFIVISSFKLY